jgi:tetratricopeptide (TPR) repeat protein
MIRGAVNIAAAVRAATPMWAALVLAAACSAPALLTDLAEAERLERAGEPDRALAAYTSAMQSCRHIRNPRQRAQTCAGAHHGHADLLADLGRKAEAADAYEAIPGALGNDPDPAGRAVYQAARLRLELGEDARAYDLFWRAIADYPDAASADLALALVVVDGRRRNPGELYQALAGLAEALAETEVADNLFFAMAELAEADLGDPAAALAAYDHVAAHHTAGPLFDDALWHGARLARALGDARGAVRRYRKLLATREVALIVGSYFSEWHDDAQLELGRVLRDDLGDASGALAAFARLPRDYPDSVLHDDAQWERAVTWERDRHADRACQALHALRKKWPDSKYELELAPTMRTRLSCAP